MTYDQSMKMTKELQEITMLTGFTCETNQQEKSQLSSGNFHITLRFFNATGNPAIEYEIKDATHPANFERCFILIERIGKMVMGITDIPNIFMEESFVVTNWYQRDMKKKVTLIGNEYIIETVDVFNEVLAYIKTKMIAIGSLEKL